jgi:hypothetical protein
MYTERVRPPARQEVVMSHSAGDGSPPEPVTRPGRALAPFVWLLAMGWLALQALGRAGLWLLTAVDAGTSAVAGVGGGAIRAVVRAVVRALGPLGRALLRLLAPLVRGLRRAWAWLNRRVFLAMFRRLGRFGRWLVARTRPAVEAVRGWARRMAVRAEPVVRRLATAAAVVERAAVRLGRAMGRLFAPVRRMAVSVGRRVRALLAAEDGHGGR